MKRLSQQQDNSMTASTYEPTGRAKEVRRLIYAQFIGADGGVYNCKITYEKYKHKTIW